MFLRQLDHFAAARDAQWSAMAGLRGGSSTVAINGSYQLFGDTS